MNRKRTTIIITGTTIATVLAIAAGCSMKKPETSRLIPVTRPAAVTVETETQETTEQRKTDGAVTQIEPISFNIGTSANTEETAPAAPTETEAKQVPQKAKKTVKKTKKVTKKVTKKNTKKTSKKNAAKQLFTYGTTNYVNGNVTVTVRITKDNKASVTVDKRTTDKDNLSYCEHFYFTGAINKKTGVLNYSDCTKMYFAGTNSGKNVRTHYTDGKGTVKFCGNQIIWTDNNSKDYQSAKFTKA